MGNGPGSPMIGGILIGKTGVIGSKVLMSERPSSVASVGTNRRVLMFFICRNSCQRLGDHDGGIKKAEILGIQSVTYLCHKFAIKSSDLDLSQRKDSQNKYLTPLYLKCRN